MHGRSLGGAVSMYALKNSKNSHKIKGVIFENTFTSIDDMADELFGFLAKALKPIILHNYWKSIDIIPHIENPLLFISAQ